MKKILITEEIWKEGDMYIAYCPELDVPACGPDIEVAKKNLREIIAIQIEETSKKGTLQEFLDAAGYKQEKEDLIPEKLFISCTQERVPIGVI